MIRGVDILVKRLTEDDTKVGQSGGDEPRKDNSLEARLTHKPVLIKSHSIKFLLLLRV